MVCLRIVRGAVVYRVADLFFQLQAGDTDSFATGIQNIVQLQVGDVGAQSGTDTGDDFFAGRLCMVARASGSVQYCRYNQPAAYGQPYIPLSCRCDNKSQQGAA